jgi:hypothetical protein
MKDPWYSCRTVVLEAFIYILLRLKSTMTVQAASEQEGKLVHSVP